MSKIISHFGRSELLGNQRNDQFHHLFFEYFTSSKELSLEPLERNFKVIVPEKFDVGDLHIQLSNSFKIFGLLQIEAQNKHRQ